MKRITLIFGIVILTISFTNAQITGGGGYEQTEKKSVVTKNNTILVSPTLPWAPFGLKYAYLGKVGLYASVSSDFLLLDETLNITIGPTFRLTPKTNIYLGGGYEPLWEEPLADFGFIFKLNKYSIDAGLCINFEEVDYSGLRLGFGINF